MDSVTRIKEYIKNNFPEWVKVDFSSFEDTIDFRKDLSDLYKICDDEIIFEWWQDSKELWLGNLDMDTFRYSAERKRYGIGDASHFSYGDEYEFDTLEGMIEAYLRGI